MISTTSRPLTFATALGGVLSFLALIAGITVLIEDVILPDPLGWKFTGSAMLGILITFLTGLILLSQGIMGLYLASVYREVAARPLYLIDSSRSVVHHEEHGE